MESYLLGPKSLLKQIIAFGSGVVGEYWGRNPLELISKAARLWQRERSWGFLRIFYQIVESGRDPRRWQNYFEFSYKRWVQDFDTLSNLDRALIQRHLQEIGDRFRISILIVGDCTSVAALQSSIGSVNRQLYHNWEILVPVNADEVPNVSAFLDRLAQSDSRIRVASFHDGVLSSGVLNRLLNMVDGEYYIFLSPGDELSEHALYFVVDALSNSPNLDVIYGDEDKVNDKGQRLSPRFKPDWNPELFLGNNFIGKCGVYRVESVREVGAFFDGFSNNSIWDLAIRIVERSDFSGITHIPHVLYHESMASNSIMVNADDLDNNAASVDHKALEVYWSRRGVCVDIEYDDKKLVRSVFKLPDVPPRVTIIIPTYNKVELLRSCIEGLFRKTEYSNIDILVVDNRSDDQDALTYLSEISVLDGVSVLRYDAPFNYAAINNWAVRQARGDFLCLLNNDVEPITPEWLREMVAQVLRPDVGAVGAMLYYPNDTIQHAGTLLNGVAADHIYSGFPRGINGYGNRARFVQSLSAVTAACMLVRREVWDAVEGMDEVNLAVAFNDVDLCLKIRQLGYRIVWTPHAELYHHESASRGSDLTPEKKARFDREVSFLQSKWGDLLWNDPAWNPNLSLDGSWPMPASPPRAEKPWLKYKDMV